MVYTQILFKKYMLLRFLQFSFLCLMSFQIFAQTGTIRGNIFDKETGEPVLYGTIQLTGTTLGTTTCLLYTSPSPRDRG